MSRVDSGLRNVIDQMGSACRADLSERGAERRRVRERDEPVRLLLEAAHPEGDLGDDAGDALRVGYVCKQLVAAELTRLTGRQHDARGGDVVLERAVLVASEARSALSEPAGHARAGIGRGVEPQSQPLLLDLAVDVLPDRRGLSRDRERVGVHRDDVHHCAHVDDDGVLRRQHAAVAGRRPRARDDLQVLSAGELHEVDDLGFGVGSDDRTRDSRWHERLDQRRHRPDVE